MSKLQELLEFCNNKNLAITTWSAPTENLEHPWEHEICLFKEFWNGEGPDYDQYSIVSLEDAAEKLMAAFNLFNKSEVFVPEPITEETFNRAVKAAEDRTGKL